MIVDLRDCEEFKTLSLRHFPDYPVPVSVRIESESRRMFFENNGGRTYSLRAWRKNKDGVRELVNLLKSEYPEAFI